LIEASNFVVYRLAWWAYWQRWVSQQSLHRAVMNSLPRHCKRQRLKRPRWRYFVVVKEGIIVARCRSSFLIHRQFNFAGGKRHENFQVRSMETQAALEIGQRLWSYRATL